MNIPAELKYTSSHEWVKAEGDDVVVVGITDHAQHLLGDMVFVDLPEPSEAFHAGDEIAVVESVKAASDCYAPVTGEVIEINEALIDSPALVNNDPYGDGWLFKLKISDPQELEGLNDAEQYQYQIAEE